MLPRMLHHLPETHLLWADRTGHAEDIVEAWCSAGHKDDVDIGDSLGECCLVHPLLQHLEAFASHCSPGGFRLQPIPRWAGIAAAQA